MPRLSSKKPPEPIEFFLDRSLGRHVFPRVLRAHGLSVHVHDEVFSQDTPDEVWITQVAASGLVAVTRDKRIGRTPTELRAVFASGLQLITLVGGDVPADKLARNFVNSHPTIAKFIAKHQAPCIARLSRPGREVVLDASGHGELRMYKSREELLAQFGGR